MSSKKKCDENSSKAQDKLHVCNDKTGNWILKTSKLGQTITGVKIKVEPKPKKKVTAMQKLEAQLNDEAEKKKLAVKHVVKMDKEMQTQKKAKVKSPIGGVAPYTTPSGHPSGAAQKGKSPKVKSPKKCSDKSPKAKDNKHVCNEKTGVWVSKTGKIGKEILAQKKIGSLDLIQLKPHKPKSPPKPKPKSPPKHKPKSPPKPKNVTIVYAKKIGK